VPAKGILSGKFLGYANVGSRRYGFSLWPEGSPARGFGENRAANSGRQGKSLPVKMYPVLIGEGKRRAQGNLNKRKEKRF